MSSPAREDPFSSPHDSEDEDNTRGHDHGIGQNTQVGSGYLATVLNEGHHGLGQSQQVGNDPRTISPANQDPHSNFAVKSVDQDSVAAPNARRGMVQSHQVRNQHPVDPDIRPYYRQGSDRIPQNVFLLGNGSLYQLPYQVASNKRAYHEISRSLQTGNVPQVDAPDERRDYGIGRSNQVESQLPVVSPDEGRERGIGQSPQIGNQRPIAQDDRSARFMPQHDREVDMAAPTTPATDTDSIMPVPYTRDLNQEVPLGIERVKATFCDDCELMWLVGKKGAGKPHPAHNVLFDGSRTIFVAVRYDRGIYFGSEKSKFNVSQGLTGFNRSNVEGAELELVALALQIVRTKVFPERETICRDVSENKGSPASAPVQQIVGFRVVVITSREYVVAGLCSELVGTYWRAGKKDGQPELVKKSIDQRVLNSVQFAHVKREAEALKTLGIRVAYYCAKF